LRLDEVYKISGTALLGEIHRHTADIKLVKKYDVKKKASIKIKSGDFFLVKTIESVNMPSSLTASITPRSTTYRSGLF